MNLKDELDAVVKAAVGDLGEIREELTALEHLMPAAGHRTLNIRQILMTLNSRLQGIKVIAAKEVMLGNEEQATRQERVEELELFAPHVVPTMVVVESAEKARAFEEARIVPMLPRHGIDLSAKGTVWKLAAAGDHTLEEGDEA